MDSNESTRRVPRDVAGTDATGAVTYAPTGGTLVEPPVAPPGFHLLDERAAIGRGGRRFEQAVAALFDWQVQRGGGVRVITDGPPTPGRRATLGVGVGPLRLSAPVVVIGVVGAGSDGVASDGAGTGGLLDDGDPGVSGRDAGAGSDVVDRPAAGRQVRRRQGFAYGTLRGHPEAGEEAFLVELDTEDVVWLRIVAFSRPATWYARLGGSAARVAQAVITRRYLHALGPRMTG